MMTQIFPNDTKALNSTEVRIDQVLVTTASIYRE